MGCELQRLARSAAEIRDGILQLQLAGHPPSSSASVEPRRLAPDPRACNTGVYNPHHIAQNSALPLSNLLISPLLGRANLGGRRYCYGESSAPNFLPAAACRLSRFPDTDSVDPYDGNC